MKRVIDLARIRKTALLLVLAAIATLLASGVALLGVAGPARAEVPPKNGKILFTSVVPPNVSREAQTMDPDGSNRTSFTPPISGSALGWSPDGTKFAFKDSAGLAVVSADGTGRIDLPNTSGASAPTWSPDGAKLAFKDGSAGLVVVGADGTGRVDLPDTSDANGSPTWSPDGAKLAFWERGDVFCDENTGQCHTAADIYTINVDGTEKTNLTNTVSPEEAMDPAWSPDGAKIAFTHQVNGGSAEIYTMNADGTGQPTGLTTPAPGAHPVWSPDGSKIAFIGFDWNLSVMNADGTGQTTVAAGASSQQQVSAHSWSPDGTRLIFGFSRDIFTTGIDGSNLTNLTNTTDLNEVAPSWAPVPDTVKPITTATSSPQPNDSGWNNSDVTVTLSATDNESGSGVKEITYSINGGQLTTEQSAAVQVPVTAEGETTIAFYATDNAGNVEDEQTFTVKLDKSVPNVGTTTPTKKTGVSRNKPNVTATFSEPVDKASVEAMDPTTLKPNVQLFNTVKGKPVAATVSCDADPCTKVAITPKKALAADTKYRATVTTGVEDLAGNALDQNTTKTGSQPKTWTFTTAK